MAKLKTVRIIWKSVDSIEDIRQEADAITTNYTKWAQTGFTEDPAQAIKAMINDKRKWMETAIESIKARLQQSADAFQAVKCIVPRRFGQADLGVSPDGVDYVKTLFQTPEFEDFSQEDPLIQFYQGKKSPASAEITITYQVAISFADSKNPEVNDWFMERADEFESMFSAIQ